MWRKKAKLIETRDCEEAGLPSVTVYFRSRTVAVPDMLVYFNKLCIAGVFAKKCLRVIKAYLSLKRLRW